MASTYLQRTQSAGNRRTFTLSYWVKKPRISNGDDDLFFFGTDGTGSITKIEFSSDQFQFVDSNYASSGFQIASTQLFRDISGWYHIVVAIDTTQAASADRAKIYVNGEQITLFSTNQRPAQNYDCFVNVASQVLNIGRGFNFSSSSAKYFEGQLAHVHFTDGTAYPASTFGETDSTTGIWKPKTSPSVTYGTNGFFLKFDNSANMGLDSSGQTNNLTTSGAMIQTKDTPSNVFATLNSLNVPTSNAPTFSIVNTKTITMNSDPGYFGGTSTLGASSGKYYAEFKVTDNNGVGALGITFDPTEKARQGTTFSAQISDSFIYANNAKQYSTATGTSGSSYGNTYTDNDIIGVAMDLDNSKLYFHKNGTYQNSGVPTSGSTGTGAIAITAGETYFFYLTDVGGSTATYECNFGYGYFGTTAVSSAQNPDDGIGIFEYDVPAGYRALCTKSLNAEEYS